MKNILIAASEAVPYVKTGGLADVAGSLPKYLDKKKYDVRVILPKYACMSDKFKGSLKFVCHCYVNLNWRRQYVGIQKAEYQGVTFYFVDNEYYFNGSTVYSDTRWDVERFAYFSKAVLQCLPFIDWTPDVIHCNDWQTGLIPVFLHTAFGSDTFYSNIKTVFSIHNLRFQGRYPIADIMDFTGLPASVFNSAELEAYGVGNYLKGGVVYADRVTTVSPTYAQEIQTPEGGEGLDGILRARSNVLSGIINGIDYRNFDPMTNPNVWHHFNRSSCIETRKLNKLEMQKLSGLPQREDVFLVGIVSRLTDQKGFDLIAFILEELLSTTDIQIVVLGTGEARYEEMFRYFQDRFPDKLNAYIGYSEGRADQIYASCDAFLMPSQFEPCGLSQLMSMHFGTLPIVRETGGLKDTVAPYNQYAKTGTGFSFANYDAFDMLHVIRLAANVYYDHRDDWNDMVRRAMDADFSWNASAKKYEALYDSIIPEDL